MSKPLLPAALVWDGDLRFRAASGSIEIVLDGDSAAGPSPVQALAFSLSACMAMDVVAVLVKGRHPVIAFDAKFVGARAGDHPHRFVRIELHFTVRGNVPGPAVERAIALSRDRYCSVWHSMRQDIDFTTTFEVVP